MLFEGLPHTALRYITVIAFGLIRVITAVFLKATAGFLRLCLELEVCF